VRYRARPGTGKGDRFVDTGSVAADEAILFNFELLFIWRSFHAQLEFFLADVSAPSGVAAEPQFSGWYVEVGYWVTGEARKYKGGVCDRTSPRKNFHGGDGGWGAWQVAVRFDSLDLIDDTIVGGEQVTYTLGVNWHWNPNARVMFNVIFANVEEPGTPDIDIEVFQMRFQFDF
jgi:phosphate-selective porin OprO/OprP